MPLNAGHRWSSIAFGLVRGGCRWQTPPATKRLGWVVNGRCASDRRWSPSRGHLRAVFLGADADLGHDEFHQFRPRRIRHARHVCGFPDRGLAARGACGFCSRRGAGSVRARRRYLRLAHPPRHPRADAVADPLHVRARAAAPLHRVLDFFGELRIAAAEFAWRRHQSRRHFSSRRAACRRRCRHHADDLAASSAHPHHRRQHAAWRWPRIAPPQC